MIVEFSHFLKIHQTTNEKLNLWVKRRKRKKLFNIVESSRIDPSYHEISQTKNTIAKTAAETAKAISNVSQCLESGCTTFTVTEYDLFTGTENDSVSFSEMVMMSAHFETRSGA
jgi:hypothetical protein